MLAGVALAASELPVGLVERHGLGRRVHERGGEPEVRFLLHDRERVLPVWLDGQLLPVRWGNRRGQSRGLPCTAWTRRETVEAGGWGDREVARVVIPATMGLDGVSGIASGRECGGCWSATVAAPPPSTSWSSRRATTMP